MVMKKVALIDDNDYSITYFTRLFETWNFDFHVVKNIHNSLLKINILKPDFIIISADIDADFNHIFSFLIEKKYSIIIFGEKNISGFWSKNEHLKGIFSSIHEINVQVLKNIFFSNDKFNLLTQPKKSHIEMVINDDIFVIEFDGLITWEEMHEIKYQIKNHIRTKKLIGVLCIFHKLENPDKELDQNITYLFSFIPEEEDIDASCIKIVTSDNRIMTTLLNEPKYRQIDKVESYMEAFMKIKSVHLNKKNLGISLDHITEKTALMENLYDIRGKLVRKAGESFTKDELMELRKNDVDKFYYANELNLIGIEIDMADLKKDAENLLIKHSEHGENVSTGNLHKKLILIVEDDPITQKLLAKMIEKLGFQFKIIGNGAEALKQAPLTNPDLILLDLMLPGLNGVEFYKQYRKLPISLSASVIVMSAINKKEVIEPLLAMGVKDYLLKPFDVNQFIKKILQYM